MAVLEQNRVVDTAPDVAAPVNDLQAAQQQPVNGNEDQAPAGTAAQLHHEAAMAGSGAGSPHQLRHAHAVEMSREGISLLVIQSQLGHADLAITSRYLRGIDSTRAGARLAEREQHSAKSANKRQSPMQSCAPRPRRAPSNR